MISKSDIFDNLRLPLAGAGAGMLSGELLFILSILVPQVSAWSPWAVLPVTAVAVCAIAAAAAIIALWRRDRGKCAVAVFLAGIIGLAIIPKLWSGFPFDLLGIWRKLAMIQAAAGLLSVTGAGILRKHVTAGSTGIILAVAIECLTFFFLLSPGKSMTVKMSEEYASQLDTPVSDDGGKCRTQSYTVIEYGPAGPYSTTPAPEWRTPCVDGSFLGLTSNRVDALARKAELGFPADSIPLRGVAYIPATSGKMPLVVFLHGSHPEQNPVYKGYGYLCGALAGQGYLAVSVDENFLNDRWSGAISRGEMEARGWILLKHLEQLRRWDSTPGHPLAGRVNLDKITLIGHSRGGRGVTLAALFNRMPYYSLDPGEKFGFGFNISAIVEIAPWDGFLFDGYLGAELRNIDYLVLLAGHDTDVYLASGLRTYNNVTFDDGLPHFKEAVYLYRATHAGFNSTCDTDLPFPYTLFARRSDFMDGPAQRDATKAILLNFMAATTFRDSTAMEAVRDYRLLGRQLPKDYYLSLSRFSEGITIADYEEDLDMTTGSFHGVSAEIPGNGGVSEEMLFLRDADQTPQDNRVLRVNSHPETSYGITLPPALSEAIDGPFTLSVDVYNFMDHAADFSVEIISADGNHHTARLRDIFILPPRLRAVPQKKWVATLPFSRDFEAMGQTVNFPFPGGNPAPDVPHKTSRSASGPLRIIFHFPADTDIAIDNITLVKG